MLGMYWFSLFLFLISSALQADDKAFYAITSLCCHIEQNIEHKSSGIYFEESDVEQLWEKAVSEERFFDALCQALNYYNQGSYNESLILLEQVWEQLNAEILYDITPESRANSYPNFSNNPLINENIRKETKNYLLPLNHPIRLELDALFNGQRVNENREALILAGFNLLDVKATSKIVVARHQNLPGFLLKIYLEDVIPNKEKAGWEWLVQRCKGAEAVRNLIKKKKLKHFVAPNKWLYPFPIAPAPKQNIKSPEIFVLLVTDMNIVTHDESCFIWKNNISRSVLDELYCILSHGLASTCVVLNEPPTKDGKFACIDTEHPKRHFDLSVVTPYLSDEMVAYWNKLVKNGGK